MKRKIKDLKTKNGYKAVYVDEGRARALTEGEKGKMAKVLRFEK